MQMPFTHPRSQPITLTKSGLSQVYGLFALAMGVTLVGVYAGMTFALPLISSGWIFLLLLVELGLVFTAQMWMRSSPLNIILFLLFPFLSGLTVTPFLMSVISGYANGAAILLNAAVSTALLSGAAAVFALTTSADLGFMARGLFFALIGLLIFSLLQVFVPSLRSGEIEMLVSGAGVVIFALFLAYDIQRVHQMAGIGASPFMLALSLYLDIFNLFLYVVRFMLAISGNRRSDW
jgi:FtsH-binding integral membrane protein